MKKILLLLLFITAIAKSQTINIPDSNFKQRLLNASANNTIATNSSHFPITIDTNGDGEIQLIEALQVYQLQIAQANILDLTGIEYFANLDNLNCSNNQLTSLSILNTLPNLSSLSCNNNQLTALNVSTLNSLTQLRCNNNLITSTSLNLNQNLIFLDCSNNPLGALNIGALTDLEILLCNSNLLTYLDVTNLVNLQTLHCNSNSFTNLNLSTLINLKNLDFSNNAINTIDLSALITLEYLTCSQNGLTSLNVSASPNLIELACPINNITSLDVSALSSLERLLINDNLLTNIDLTALSNLKHLNCNFNLFTTLDINSLTNLQHLTYGNEGLGNIDVGNQVNLETLLAFHINQLPANMENLQNLKSFSIFMSEIEEIDVSNLSSLIGFNSYNNSLLSYANLKNGNDFTAEGISFSNNPNLLFVCVNDTDVNNVFSVGVNNGDFQVNSYCTFTPGGNYNTIKGAVLLNCDQQDATIFTKMIINDGIVQGTTFTNQNGEYKFYTQQGTYIIIPDIENASFFTLTPPINAVVFTDNNNNQETIDFCITANGVHPDLEIVIAPIIPARPGFDAVYKIVYKNKGNTTLSQQYGIVFFYDENLMDFVSTTYPTSSLNSGSLSWDYANLKPFENRSFYVTLNINSPTQNPAVNIGDLLTLTASIFPQTGDENTADNLFQYNQTVVGSFDPNDITCLEGNMVSPSQIGNYLHYNIRFENTGTAPAENIVVKTEVNPADFDVNTLQLMNSSHPVVARINANKVEFIFQNINLDSGGHGNVLLKIKTKPTLITGDIVEKRANIFFDYNFPIQTNNAETVFQSLNNPIFEQDNTIKIFPNPTNSFVNISGNFNIKTTELFDTQGRLLQTNIINENTTTLDISAKSNGVYFIKVTSEEGIKVEKIIKQ